MPVGTHKYINIRVLNKSTYTACIVVPRCSIKTDTLCAALKCLCVILEYSISSYNVCAPDSVIYMYERLVLAGNNPDTAVRMCIYYTKYIITSQSAQ